MHPKFAQRIAEVNQSSMRNVKNTMLLWNPDNKHQIKLVTYPEKHPTSNAIYPCSEFGCTMAVHTMSLEDRKKYAKKVFNRVIRDYKMDKVTVREVFAELEEYDASFK